MDDVTKMRTGGGGGQKSWKFCVRTLWMAPYKMILMIWMFSYNHTEKLNLHPIIIQFVQCVFYISRIQLQQKQSIRLTAFQSTTMFFCKTEIRKKKLTLICCVYIYLVNHLYKNPPANIYVEICSYILLQSLPNRLIVF